jgi:hypothetical protein
LRALLPAAAAALDDSISSLEMVRMCLASRLRVAR